MSQPPHKPAQAEIEAEKKRRLAEQLRANLRKRKSQARALEGRRLDVIRRA